MAINVVLNLKKELKTKGAFFGAKVPFKKSEFIWKIYISKDCPSETKEKLKKLSKKHEIELISLDFSKEELKDICKKPFNISVASIFSEKPKQKQEEKMKEQKQEEKKEEQTEENKEERKKKEKVKKKTKKETKTKKTEKPKKAKKK